MHCKLVMGSTQTVLAFYHFSDVKFEARISKLASVQGVSRKQ